MVNKGSGRERPAGASGKGAADGASKSKRKGPASKKSNSVTNSNASGGKGAKGKAGKNGNKGDGKGSKKENSGSLTGAKTVQEIEAKMLLSGLAKGSGQGGFEKSKERELAKQPLEAKGVHCEVRKHSEMGCAVVTFQSEAVRDCVMKLVEKKFASGEKGPDDRPSIKVADVDVQMRPHFDKVQHEEVKTDLFVAWGRQAEKQAPLAVQILADAVDELVLESDAAQEVPAPTPAMPKAFGLAPMLNTGVAPAPVQMPVTQAPVFTTQLAPSPMAPSQMVASSPMPQPTTQPSNYVDLMKFANWAQQHQVAHQQMPQQAPMSGPTAVSPAAAPTAPQAMVAAPQALPAAPPAAPAAYGQGVMAPGSLPSAEMRADAPPFQHSAAQHNYFDQSNDAGVMQNYFDQNNEADQYSYWNDQMQNGHMQTPTKRFNIVNPTTGEAINMFTPMSTPIKTPAVPLPPKNRLEIKDPTSGDKIDVRSMLLTPPKTQPGLSIIDPNSGSPIKV
mmetsp:Transcript_631/g.1084  ORF Transcript_631/g.1084 Transcript_631/m.1084 type:complete len:503 (-) Transcript_631:176-1684(-)